MVGRSLAANAATIDRADAREREVGAKRDAARRGDLREANDDDVLGRRLRRVNAAEKANVAAMAASEAAVDPATMEAVARLAQERVMGSNDMVSVAYLELAMTAARSVCRIRLRSSGGQAIGWGTGFMVSPDLLLTNHHVLRDDSLAAAAFAEFDIQDDYSGLPLDGRMFPLEPGRFFETDEGLDWTLVAVGTRSIDEVAISEFGWLPLMGQVGKVANAEFLNIIQHPGGGPKLMSLRENRLVDRLPNHLHYESDTAPGSSGAPVFNDQWEVLALHHAAYPRKRGGQILAMGGEPWTDAMGEDRIDWAGNEGIRASILVDAFGRLAPRGRDGRKLLDGLAAAERAPWPPFYRRGKPWPPGREREAASPGGTTPSLGSDGSITWTLPLSVTVRMGGLPGAGAASSPAQPERKPAAAPPSAPARDTADDAEVARFLEFHRAAARRTYYDKGDDDIARDRYYRGIDLSERVEAGELRAALSRHLEGTHATPRRYKPLEFVYPWVDKRKDGKLRSIYSGEVMDVEEVIRTDLEVDRIRRRAAEAMESGDGNEVLDAFEASFPYNCEHVVPQSWFGKSEPARGDLHHLFTCESGCNSFRGNIPYWDFPDFEEVVRDKCGKREIDRFEPTAGKGAVARATLYFLLRYPRDVGGRYDPNRIAMLVDWCRAKRVDEWEQHRNAEIQKLQGNRNPFIDFPELAERLFPA